jgi:hypothetical protein
MLRHVPLREPRVESGTRLSRRDAMQILAGAIGAGAAIPALAEGHPMRSHLSDHALVAQAEAKVSAADWKPEFLDPHQFETLKSLAERILPGAAKAKTAEFIDQLLVVDTQPDQRRFLSAIGAFEGRSLERTRRPWTGLTAAEQDEILREASSTSSGMPADQPWAAGKPIVASAPAGPVRLTLRDQFDLLKGWIAGAYYSSEIGMRELGWTGNVFHTEFPGCQHPGGHP